MDATVHCKDKDPEKCAEEISSYIFKRWGKVRIGFIGLNPAIAERLVTTFGKKNVKITDLNRANINKEKYGVIIRDGKRITEELVQSSDLILVTGTTLVNGTFDNIWELIQEYRKDYLIYGVTAAGISKLIGLDRICPYGRDQ